MSKKYLKFIPTARAMGVSLWVNSPESKPPQSVCRCGRKPMVSGFIFLSLFLIITFSNLLAQTQSCQASSTKTDITDQLNNTAKAGWGAEPTGQSSLAGIIQITISAFLSLLGIIFIVLIVYAGYNWMMAGGDEEKVTLAKQTLSRAVIGLIIIVAAYSITYFVFISLPSGDGNSAFGT